MPRHPFHHGRKAGAAGAPRRPVCVTVHCRNFVSSGDEPAGRRLSSGASSVAECNRVDAALAHCGKSRRRCRPAEHALHRPGREPRFDARLGPRRRGGRRHRARAAARGRARPGARAPRGVGRLRVEHAGVGRAAVVQRSGDARRPGRGVGRRRRNRRRRRAVALRVARGVPLDARLRRMGRCRRGRGRGGPAGTGERPVRA